MIFIKFVRYLYRYHINFKLFNTLYNSYINIVVLVAIRLNANSHPINGWLLFSAITAKCRGDFFSHPVNIGKIDTLRRNRNPLGNRCGATS